MKSIFISLLILLSFSVFAKPSYEVLLKQDDVIWGFDFLKDGRIIFTERGGKIFVFDPKTKKATLVKGTPAVHAVGQGGMLDIRVHPKNDFIYLTYSAPEKDEKTSATTLARAKLVGDQFSDFKILFSADKSTSDLHFGSRIEFYKDYIFVTSGEREERKLIQKKDNYLGKIVRLKEDGSSPEVWSLGHRSPQGLVIRPGTSELWEAEMGPRGGDEINLIKKDANYGWPVVTYGREYYGPKIGVPKKEGVEEPLVYWVPSISPSAITFWKNDLWIGTLSGEHLRRLELDGLKVKSQKEFFKDLGWRWRNVRSGPDGHLYFSTDEGRLGKVISIE